MFFHDRRKKVEPININIDGIPIEFVKQFNYLGIVLDANLSWGPHIQTIHQKISRTVGIMCKLKNYIPTQTLLILYNTLVLPHLNYGILAWGIKCCKLEKIQKKSVRIMTNAKYNAHTSPIFKKLQLLKISDLCALQELKYLYKFENQLLPIYFLSIAYQRHSDRHNYGTRNAQSLESLQHRHNFVNNSICFRFPKILNNCPLCIKDKIYSHSMAGFTRYAKKYLLNNYSEICSRGNCYICQNST